MIEPRKVLAVPAFSGEPRMMIDYSFGANDGLPGNVGWGVPQEQLVERIERMQRGHDDG